MKEIIKSIYDEEFTEENISEFLSLLNQYYDIHERHSYSEITNLLYDLSDEQIQYFNLNFLVFKEYFSKNSGGCIHSQKIIKFIDHTTLELNRIDYFKKIQIENENKIKWITDSATTTFERKTLVLNERFNTSSEEIKKVSDESIEKVLEVEDKLSTNIISVLGIFAAFITAFSGGISVFGSIMQYLHKASTYRLVFTLFLFGLIYFDVCYALIYAVSRMTKKKIISSNAEESLQPITKFWPYIKDRAKKYPLFFAFNTIMILGIIVITFMYFNQSTTESLLGFIDRLRK